MLKRLSCSLLFPISFVSKVARLSLRYYPSLRFGDRYVNIAQGYSEIFGRTYCLCIRLFDEAPITTIHPVHFEIPKEGASGLLQPALTLCFAKLGGQLLPITSPDFKPCRIA